MTQINSNQFQVQNYTSDRNLQATKQLKGAHGIHNKGDNIVHVSENVNTLIQDLNGAVNAVKQGSATAVLNLDDDASSQEIYLRTDDQVVALSIEDAKTFLADLKALAEQPGFSFNYAKLNLALSENQVHISTEGGVASAQEVLDKSNANSNDKWWEFMNGGANTLTKDDPALSVKKVGPQAKPAAWYNGISIKDGKPSVYTSEKSPIPAPYEMKEMKDLQFYIQKNMDINGAFSELAAKATELGRSGSELFIESMGVQDDPFRSSLLQEVYAYATTGAASDGSVDIGKLQAILRAYDPEMHATASSNTAFNGPQFTIGGQTLNEGDGVLGRATILEMRHIGVGIEIDSEQTLNTTLEYDPPDFIDPEADIVIAFDVSGSMANNTSKTKQYMDQTLTYANALQYGKQNMEGSIRALAFNSNAANNGKGQQVLVDNEGLTVTQDQLDNIGRTLSQSKGYHHESSFVAALSGLEQFDGPPGPDSKAREVIVLSDEPDHNPNQMREMLAKADEVGATVRFIDPERDREITSDQLKDAFYVDGEFSEEKYLKFILNTSELPSNASMELLDYAPGNVSVVDRKKGYSTVGGQKLKGTQVAKHEGVASFSWARFERQFN